jgi:hypothetical protein
MSSIKYITRITFHIYFYTVPTNERIIFGPQVTCRDHRYLPSSPIVLNPEFDKYGCKKMSSVEIQEIYKEISRGDICILYLNYKDVIKTFFIENPRGENEFHFEVF